MPETDLEPDEVVPPAAVIVRFSPMSVEGVLRQARNAHSDRGSEDEPRYFVSLYIDREAADANDADTIDALLEVAKTQGIQPPPRNRHIFVTTARQLLARGFSFKKDRYAGEPEQHYSVDLGSDPSEDDAARFVGAFEGEGSKQRWPTSSLT